MSTNWEGIITYYRRLWSHRVNYLQHETWIACWDSCRVQYKEFADNWSYFFFFQIYAANVNPPGVQNDYIIPFSIQARCSICSKIPDSPSVFWIWNLDRGFKANFSTWRNPCRKFKHLRFHEFKQAFRITLVFITNEDCWHAEKNILRKEARYQLEKKNV